MTPYLRYKIGKEIRRLRQAECLTVADLATRAKMSASRVRQIEGDYTGKNFSTVERLLDALGYEIEIVRREGR